MQISLKGRRALVSGSTSGIGFATALGLARAGGHVILNGRSEDRVDEAVKRLAEIVPAASVEGISADLSTAEGSNVLVRLSGDVDILINNIGVVQFADFFEATDDDWERLFQTNVMSGVRLSRAILPQMMDRGWGRIIFVSSESGMMVPKEAIHYGMTKTAQLTISRGLAEVAAGTNVTVNTVVPGPTRSEGLLGFLDDIAADGGRDVKELEREFVSDFRPSSLIKRIADVEEVANMIVYLVSPQASATTGAALRVDGSIVQSIG